MIICSTATMIVSSSVALLDFMLEFPEPSVPGICIYKACGAQFESEAVLFLACRAIWLQAEYGYIFTGICYMNSQRLLNDNPSKMYLRHLDN